MGSCINKSSDIITLRRNERGSGESSIVKIKRNKVSKDYLLSFNSKIDNEKKFTLKTLPSNDISEIVLISEFKSNDSSIYKNNSIREVLELFD